MLVEAIILAGGQGTRLRSVVADRPKPMALVAGRPFLEYQIDHLISQGIQRVILSVGYRHELIQRHFGCHYRNIEIGYAVEESPLGTGGGLLLALQQCDANNNVLALNGDTWFPLDLVQMASLHQATQADVTVALRHGAGDGRYGGVVLDGSQRIVNFSSSGERQSHHINGGAYLISPRCQSAWSTASGRHCSLELELLETGIKQGLLCYGFISDAPFIDIGVPEDYARAADVINSE